MQMCPKCSENREDGVKFCSQCGEELIGLLAKGTILQGKYRVVAALGHGGMGAVYQAEDTQNAGQFWAVKELRDLNSVKMFFVEAGILQQLSHPQLPQVRASFSENIAGHSRQYLVMDYIAGQSLEDIVMDNRQRGEFLRETVVLGWATQLCEALHYLHTLPSPIIHRDIKPANIRLTPNGEVKLVDFGIAKIVDPNNLNKPTTKGARGAGTPGYAPVEQYGAGHTDARTDIYALGATLYTLLTNEVPPESVDRLGNNVALPSPRQINPEITPHTEQVILRALALEAGQRYKIMPEMADALLGKTTPAVKCAQCGAPNPLGSQTCYACRAPIVTAVAVKPLISDEAMDKVMDATSHGVRAVGSLMGRAGQQAVALVRSAGQAISRPRLQPRIWQTPQALDQWWLPGWRGAFWLLMLLCVWLLTLMEWTELREVITYRGFTPKLAAILLLVGFNLLIALGVAGKQNWARRWGMVELYLFIGGALVSSFGDFVILSEVEAAVIPLHCTPIGARGAAAPICGVLRDLPGGIPAVGVAARAALLLVLAYLFCAWGSAGAVWECGKNYDVRPPGVTLLGWLLMFTGIGTLPAIGLLYGREVARKVTLFLLTIATVICLRESVMGAWQVYLLPALLMSLGMAQLFTDEVKNYFTAQTAGQRDLTRGLKLILGMLVIAGAAALVVTINPYPALVDTVREIELQLELIFRYTPRSLLILHTRLIMGTAAFLLLVPAIGVWGRSDWARRMLMIYTFFPLVLASGVFSATLGETLRHLLAGRDLAHAAPNPAVATSAAVVGLLMLMLFLMLHNDDAAYACGGTCGRPAGVALLGWALLFTGIGTIPAIGLLRGKKWGRNLSIALLLLLLAFNVAIISVEAWRGYAQDLALDLSGMIRWMRYSQRDAIFFFPAAVLWCGGGIFYLLKESVRGHFS